MAENQFTSDSPENSGFTASIDALKALTTEVMTLRTNMKEQAKITSKLTEKEQKERDERAEKMKALNAAQDAAIKSVNEKFSKLSTVTEESFESALKQINIAKRSQELAKEVIALDEKLVDARLESLHLEQIANKSQEKAVGGLASLTEAVNATAKAEQDRADLLKNVVDGMKSTSETVQNVGKALAVAARGAEKTASALETMVKVPFVPIATMKGAITAAYHYMEARSAMRQGGTTPQTNALSQANTPLPSLADLYVQLEQMKKFYRAIVGAPGSLEERLGMLTIALAKMGKSVSDSIMQYESIKKTVDFIKKVYTSVFSGMMKMWEGTKKLWNESREMWSNTVNTVKGYYDSVRGFIQEWFSISGLLKFAAIATIFSFKLVAAGLKKLYTANLFGEKSFLEFARRLRERQTQRSIVGVSAVQSALSGSATSPNGQVTVQDQTVVQVITDTSSNLVNALGTEFESQNQIMRMLPQQIASAMGGQQQGGASPSANADPKTSWLQRLRMGTQGFMQNLKNGMQGLKGGFATVRAGMVSFAMTMWTTITSIVATVTTALMPVITAVVAAIGSVVTAIAPFVGIAAAILAALGLIAFGLYKLYENNEKFRNFVNDLIDGLKSLAEKIQSTVSFITDLISNPEKTIATTGAGAVGSALDATGVTKGVGSALLPFLVERFFGSEETSIPSTTANPMTVPPQATATRSSSSSIQVQATNVNAATSGGTQRAPIGVPTSPTNQNGTLSALRYGSGGFVGN